MVIPYSRTPYSDQTNKQIQQAYGACQAMVFRYGQAEWSYTLNGTQRTEKELGSGYTTRQTTLVLL